MDTSIVNAPGLEFLFGALFVAVYAMERFNTLTHHRPTAPQLLQDATTPPHRRISGFRCCSTGCSLVTPS
jgi:hypothetical protein